MKELDKKAWLEVARRLSIGSAWCIGLAILGYLFYLPASWAESNGYFENLKEIFFLLMVILLFIGLLMSWKESIKREIIKNPCPPKTQLSILYSTLKETPTEITT